MYKVFVRAWWKHNEKWPNGLEPDPSAERKYIAEVDTEDEARSICREYNSENDPGELAVKAEYSS